MTLIELLVSLFIVGLLTAVAMPLFSSYQRKNTLVSDAESLSQLFSYSRALLQNPEISARVSAKKGYVIKLSAKNNTAEIIEAGNQNNQIDKIIFDSREKLSFNSDGVATSDEIEVTISGKPPKEIMECRQIKPDGSSNVISCASKLLINITATGVAGASKKIIVQNSNNVTGELFSISME